MTETQFEESFRASAKEQLKELMETLRIIRESLKSDDEPTVILSITVTRLLHDYTFKELPVKAALINKNFTIEVTH